MIFFTEAEKFELDQLAQVGKKLLSFFINKLTKFLLKIEILAI